MANLCRVFQRRVVHRGGSGWIVGDLRWGVRGGGGYSGKPMKCGPHLSQRVDAQTAATLS